MLNQAGIIENVENLFKILDQEIAKGVSFEFVEILNRELKEKYAGINNLKSARGVRTEKAAFLDELEKLVTTVQYVFIAEKGDKDSVPVWAKNTNKAEALSFYASFLNELKNLPPEKWKVVFLYREHEISYYAELLQKITALENQKGTRENYLTLINIRRALISTLCLCGWKYSELTGELNK